MTNTNIATWLESKYIEWISVSGERRTISEFAAWLDISQSLLSRYMNGTRTPSRKNTDKIAARLGPEIYDLLGLQRPDPLLQRLQTQWHLLTDEELGEITRIIENAVDRNKRKRNI